MTRHDYYGVPLWLLKHYLVGLGGAEVSENVVAGEGWQATLCKAEPRRLGALVVGGSSAEFTGEEQALAALFEKLHWKTQRGGG